MIRRAIILVLAWFGGPMLTAADRPTTTKPSTSQASSGPSEIVIPAGRLDALLTVSVQIADSGPHLLIVDTGASFVILDEALANRLALPPASLRANKALTAGIRPGDALMSYDGRPAEGLTLARWRALFRSTDEIRCRFQRGDDTYDVALREAILLPVIE